MPTSKPEEIVVIGGGLSGCLAALFAARVKGDNGNPRYHVTLLERNDHILSGSSMVAARLHLGGEYPLHKRTANNCMWGAMLWKLIFEQGIFTNQKPMRFFIAKETHQKAREGDKESLTLEKYWDHFHHLNDQYDAMVSHIAKTLMETPEAAQWLKITIPPMPERPGNLKAPRTLRDRQQLKKWEEDTKQRLASEIIPQVEQALFGSSQDFVKRITPHSADLEIFNNHLQGGIISKEPGLDIAGYLSGIEPALLKAGVNIVTNVEVSEIKENPRDGGYQLVINAQEQPIKADQIVQAAWDGGFALDGPHRSFAKEVWVHRRAMAIVDTHNIPVKKLPHVTSVDSNGVESHTPYGCFVLKNEFGGMYSPINADVALVYHPIIARLGTAHLNSADPENRNIPESWKEKLTSAEKSELLTRYKEAIVNGPFPFLKDADFVDVIVRPTLNFDENLDWRKHEPTEEIKPGYHVMYSTKLTLAPASAIEAVENLRQRSHLKEENRGKAPLETHVGLNTAFKTVLRDDTYRIAGLIKPNRRENLYDFLRKLGLGIALSNLLIKRTPYSGPPSEHEPPEHLPPQPATVEASAPKRSFGLGFGPYKVSVYTENGPKTGPLFDADPQKNKIICEHIKDWLENGNGPLTNILPAEQLVFAVNNLLIHSDTLHLVQLMDKPGSLLPGEKTHALLFSKQNIARFPEETWDIIRKSRREMPSLEKLRSLEGLDQFMAWLPKKREIMAAMLPVLFQTLDKDAQAQVAGDLANGLHQMGIDKSFFAPLANPDLNHVVIKGKNEPLKAMRILNNHGRSLQVDFQLPGNPQPADLSIEFQGKTFYPVQFHFHRTRTLRKNDSGIETDAEGRALTNPGVKNKVGELDGAFEFKLYRNKEHEEACKAKSQPDPNDHNDVVGELHSIFMTPPDPTTRHRTALALCAHVKLGPENAELGEYIELLRAHNRPLDDNEEIKRDTLPFKALSCFNHGQFDTECMPEAPFASLHMGNFKTENGQVVLKEGSSDIFYRGVHVIHLPDEQSVTISPQQMEALEKAQPALTELPKEQGIWPFAKAIDSWVAR